jgi:hypothetical protein
LQGYSSDDTTQLRLDLCILAVAIHLMRSETMAGTAIEQACKAEIPTPPRRQGYEGQAAVKTRACDVFATVGRSGTKNNPEAMKLN